MVAQPARSVAARVAFLAIASPTTLPFGGVWPVGHRGLSSLGKGLKRRDMTWKKLSTARRWKDEKTQNVRNRPRIDAAASSRMQHRSAEKYERGQRQNHPPWLPRDGVRNDEPIHCLTPVADAAAAGLAFGAGV